MADIEKDKAFKAPADANALSKHFDSHNGDFDTAQEFVRAYLNNDRRALEALGVQNMEKLRDVLENMYPDIREKLHEETSTVEHLKTCLENLKLQKKS